MNIVLLSGGSGKRLWPLSNDIRSKQFVKLFKKDDGTYESMVQRVYAQIKAADADADITIATGKSQVSAIHNQLGDKVSVCVEPARRDTFPAIALAAAYLYYEKNVDRNEAIVICPVDPYVEDDYFSAVTRLGRLAEEGMANIVLMGMEPTYPSEKYGYIIPKNKEEISEVKTFKEKPTADVAKEYITEGALWNGGVFALKLGYIIDISHKMMEYTDYKDLYKKYHTLEKISFDYAVVEKESSIAVLRFKGQWKDIGTWNTFAEEMDEPIIGNAVMNETCENTNVINELEIPVLCMGCKNMIVAVSGDGILVSDKEQSSYIKPFVDKFDNQVMFAEKSWGSFTVIDVQDTSMTIRILLRPGNKLNYHCHEHRSEVWTIISGKGRAIIDGEEIFVEAGSVITLPVGCKHTLIAETELKAVEVQVGADISVKDKIKF